MPTHAEILHRIREAAVVPIVRVRGREEALRVAEALLEGGLSCVEITFTVDGALGVIEALAGRLGESALIGAGTVLDPETARAAILAGAQFIVSPALNRATVELARRYAKPVFPGALTPTEVLAAWEAGADAVKVFPCSALGGARYIRALKAPFPQIELCPTGGVNLETLRDFFLAGAMAVGVGAELVDPALVSAGDFLTITRRAHQFREAAREARTRNP